MQTIPQAFEAMAGFDQFILYKTERVKNKLKKTPISPVTKQTVSVTSSKDWVPAKDAMRIARGLGSDYGVGFVFTKDDPFFFLDIDKCLTKDNKWSPLANNLLSELNGAAYEVSSSGKGLHIFGTGAPPRHACRNSSQNIELYTESRFVALTAMHANGRSDFDCTGPIGRIVQEYFPPRMATLEKSSDASGPVPLWNGHTDDVELIAHARKSRSAASVFGNKAQFKDLWEANEAILATTYPASDDDVYNRSDADAALAQHLAFWTGNDEDRMERLMRDSQLYREKYERTDYLPRTIKLATGRQSEWFSRKTININTKSGQDANTLAKPALRGATSFMTLPEQQTIFAGCVYICDSHTVLVPGGGLLNKERFDVMFGGYNFTVGEENAKIIRSAWDAFTQSQGLQVPKVDSSYFHPLDKPGLVRKHQGQELVNSWWPVDIDRKAGDPGPFLLHITKLLPDENDQRMLLAYLAALVQHQGVKFKWCPLIQGVEGNGKTLLTKCITAAIGEKHSYMPNASKIVAKFNDWVYGKTFAGIEDIYVPYDKNEVMEAMKVLITGERQEIEGKGTKKVTRGVCINFLLNSNHKDAIRKTKNDRRFAPFYTAQQSVEDLQRDGLTQAYFVKLHRWLEDEDGYAITSEFLHTYSIPDALNPASGCLRAPQTSSTDQAIIGSRGRIEQEIHEAIESGVPGFRGGWVNSKALVRLLEENRLAKFVPPGARRELMGSLGYVWHPHLKEGRATRVVPGENTKPVLYIIKEHVSASIQAPCDIMIAYDNSQK